MMKYLIDEQDFPLIQGKTWCISALGYVVARCKETKKVIYMHRLIMGNPQGKCIDHINGDKHDNRRCNLRICSKGENIRNGRKRIGDFTSKYKGVFFDKRRNSWRSEITVNYKNKYLGRFFSEEDAAKAYNTAAINFFGEFAKLNVI